MDFPYFPMIFTYLFCSFSALKGRSLKAVVPASRHRGRAPRHRLDVGLLEAGDQGSSAFQRWPCAEEPNLGRVTLTAWLFNGILRGEKSGLVHIKY